MLFAPRDAPVCAFSSTPCTFFKVHGVTCSRATTAQACVPSVRQVIRFNIPVIAAVPAISSVPAVASWAAVAAVSTISLAVAWPSVSAIAAIGSGTAGSSWTSIAAWAAVYTAPPVSASAALFTRTAWTTCPAILAWAAVRPTGAVGDQKRRPLWRVNELMISRFPR
ncbi:hypothetical protein Rleg10DRAFT_3523 [Rhizobium leguminosarum bv. trifolii WSM2012]|nr:hypothetical protein Rleg10DRAFT_3523 [Rhizobium leguminosarum bv. trifolii WSM2012]